MDVEHGPRTAPLPGRALGPDVDQPPSELAHQQHRLSETIELLRERTAVLVRRLGPVTAEAMPQPEGTYEDQLPFESPVGAWIRDQHYAVLGILQLVEDAHNRLRV